MPRQARIVLPKLAHHITQRGNYRMKVFDKESDYQRYCEWMNEYAGKYDLDIAAYCLMTNHVHFIVIPKDKESLSKVFNTVHMRYAHYLNRRRKVKGHLWQGRFYSCVMDEGHLYRAIRYVERNPVRAKMVKKAEDYRWSSARGHLGMENESVIGLCKDYRFLESKDWKAYLMEEDEAMNKEMRLKTSRGLVIGKAEFIKKLEDQLSRSLQCLKWGRPKKSV